MINILLVEDDPCDQQLAKWILAKPLQTVEFTIETAGSAKIGLERLRFRSFDLVLLDLALPDSDGLETVETFHNANSKIPVVVLTGLDSEETGLEAIKKGAADYLVKGRGIKHQLAKSILYALERGRAEEELQENETKFRAIFDHTFQFIGLMTPDGILIEANRTALAFAGIKDSDVLGKPFWETPWWTHSTQMQDKLRAAVKAASQGQFVRFEATHPASDGSIHYIDFSLKPVKNETGDVVLLIPEGRDITERKRAEEVLRASEAKYRILLENLPQKIFFKDRNLAYISCNDNYARDLKIKSEEIVGRTDYDFYPKELAEKYRADDKRIMETGKIEDIEGKYIRQGDEACVHTVKTPVKDDQGNIIGLLGIFRDITHRKKTEEELRKSEKAAKTAYEQLEKANNELKSMHCQMVQSEKLAAIGHLAAGVAHEMNTPVGFVASNFQTLESYVNKFKKLLEMYDELVKTIKTSEKTELLTKAEVIAKAYQTMKMDFVLEDIQELFSDSKEGLERVTTIIENLRDFSRIDQTDSFGEYNINDGINTTLAVARNTIKYDAEVKTELSEVPVVFCNASQINQVFLNIILNAVQAIKTQEKGEKGVITIRTCSTEDEVVCEITDNGPGIPAEIISKIFDPFFTTKPAGKGTGLGLSISYDIIVNKHKGKILVDSTVGKGAKFTIKLPTKTKKENNTENMENYNEKKECVVSMKTGG
jgi:PAS domain S-box-containing protein